jgi:hypothetical protein
MRSFARSFSLLSASPDPLWRRGRGVVAAAVDYGSASAVSAVRAAVAAVSVARVGSAGYDVAGVE